MQMSQRGVNGLEVFLNDGVAFFAVGFLNRILNLRDSFIFRQNVGNGEEAGLHNGVNALTHTGFASNFNRIDGVEFQLFADDFFLNFNRQVIPYFISAVRSVQQESCARFGDFQDVNLAHERELVASHKVRFVNQVSRLNRVIREAQVRSGHRAGFAGVINEVTLAVFTGVFGNNLN